MAEGAEMRQLESTPRRVVSDVTSARTAESTSRPLFGLTRRQMDVLQLLIQRKPNKLICPDIRSSEGTVKVHVSAILKFAGMQA
jgi:DNA-binding NarL/FixJ family response regulator